MSFLKNTANQFWVFDILGFNGEPLSGLAGTLSLFYSLDGTDWLPLTNTEIEITGTPAGSYSVELTQDETNGDVGYYRATDPAGNGLTASDRIVFLRSNSSVVAFFKNFSGQFWVYDMLGFDGEPVTGLAGSTNLYFSLDGAAWTSLTNTATELGGTAIGSYKVQLTQSETNGEVGYFRAESGGNALTTSDRIIFRDAFVIADGGNPIVVTNPGTDNITTDMLLIIGFAWDAGVANQSLIVTDQNDKNLFSAESTSQQQNIAEWFPHAVMSDGLRVSTMGAGRLYVYLK